MNIEPRLGTISDEVSAAFETALDWIVAQGLSWVELRTVNGTNVVYLSDAEVACAVAAIRQRGLRVSAIASPLFKCALDPARPVAAGDTFAAMDEPLTSHMARLPRTLAIARAFGTRFVRVFSGWRELDPTAHTDDVIRLLGAAAAAEAARHETILLLENEPSCNGGMAAEAAEIVRRVGSPALRILWDPGNEAHTGRKAFPDGYRAVSGLIGHVHLKDAARGPDGRACWLPLGAGQVDVAAQVKALEADHYDGLYVIETHYQPVGGTKLEGSGETLAGLRSLLGARS